MEGALPELVFLKSLTERLEKDADELKVVLEECMTSRSDFKQVPRLERIIDDYNGLRILILNTLEANKLRNLLVSSLGYVSNDFLYFLTYTGETRKKERKATLTLYSSDIPQAISVLETISNRCHALVSSFEILLKPKASPDTITKLGSLREELKKLEDKLEDGVNNDLNEAINEMEQGHFLAASMIASRVICYILNKIPGENDEEKTSKLINLGIIEKERKDERENFIKASRLSRNLLSHRAGLSSKPDEALQLISSAITFARYLVAFSQRIQKE